MKEFAEKIDRYFDIAERGSSLRIELLAGVSTFLSLSYIVVVNPAVLSEANFDKSAVFFATIVVSAVATIAMGLVARLPFALAPGLEMDAYVAFFIVGVLQYDTRQAMGIVFWSTMIFFILSIRGTRKKIIDSIPAGMKHALSMTIGVFVALIGLKLAGLIVFKQSSPSGIGSFASPQAITLYIGLGVILLCEAVKFRGGVLVSIVIASIFCATQGLSEDVEPIEISSKMFSLVGQPNFSVILDPRSWAPILILFLIDFYGSVAKIVGLTVNTSIYDPSTKQAVNTNHGLWVDGTAAAMSPLVGTSSVTTFVESAVGIKVGGRTGITAIVCGSLMFATFFLAPLLNFVPAVAASGSLVIVGWWLLPSKDVRARFRTEDWVIAIGSAIMAAVSFSLENSMLFAYSGYLMHVVFWKRETPNIYLVVSFLLLLAGVGLRLFGVSQ